MSLPAAVRVKISSEAAGFIAITPVVAKEMPVRELVELMLGVAGKDVSRIHELLLRGAFISGASRFRWQGWDADREALAAMLSTFPEPEPSRPFAGERCIRAVLHGPQFRLDIAREAGEARRLFRRRSFWDLLMETVASCASRYVEYSYRDRADRYEAELPPDAAARLRAGAPLLKYSSLEAALRNARPETVELLVER